MNSKAHFSFGLFLGILIGASSWALAKNIPSAQAQKPTQLDIIYNVVSQNFYITQKLIAYQEYQREISMLLSDRTKVKMEQVVPLTNRLQQELFTLDLKVKELNK